MKLEFINDPALKLSNLPGDSITVDAVQEPEIPEVTSSLESYDATVPQQNCPDTPPDSDGVPGEPPMFYRKLPFERVVLEEEPSLDGSAPKTVVKWTFFLNTTMPAFQPRVLNEFALLMQQVQPGDYVDIWAPSFADTDLIASGMISVILDYLQRTGNTETTIVHAPYCLNTGAALFLTLPCKKSVSPYMYCRITPPEVFAVGVHRDVVSGVEQQIGVYEAMLKRLVDAKIISDKDLIEILNSQKTIFVYGDHLVKQLSGQ